MLKGLLYFSLNKLLWGKICMAYKIKFVFASCKNALDIYNYIACITKHMHIYV